MSMEGLSTQKRSPGHIVQGAKDPQVARLRQRAILPGAQGEEQGHPGESHDLWQKHAVWDCVKCQVVTGLC